MKIRLMNTALLAFLLMITSCSDHTAAASGEPHSASASSVVSASRSEPEPSQPSQETPPRDAVEPPENTLPVDVSLPIHGKTGEAINGEISFSICLPAEWTRSDAGAAMEFFDAGETKVAEAAGRDLTLEETDALYPDAVMLRDFTVGEYQGRYYHMQTDREGDEFTALQNDLIYCLDIGDGMIVITFYPYYGTGIGTQNERFASYIDTILMTK